MDWKKRPKAGSTASALSRLFFLALFFLAGVILGQVMVSCVSDTTGQELSDYLRDYVTLDSVISADMVCSVFLLYFRYPVLAILLGFASIGMALLPCLSAIFGFFLSFSVCCFTAAFGSDGVLLALAVFGLRCLVTLPCYFLLASSAWGKAMSLATLSFGRGRAPVTYGRDWWGRIGVCVLVLLVGSCAELVCVPWFLDLVLNRVLS